MNDLYLNSVIKRWLQEANELRELARKRGADDEEAMVSEVEARRLEICAGEISKALNEGDEST